MHTVYESGAVNKSVLLNQTNPTVLDSVTTREVNGEVSQVKSR